MKGTGAAIEDAHARGARVEGPPRRAEVRFEAVNELSDTALGCERKGDAVQTQSKRSH